MHRMLIPRAILPAYRGPGRRSPRTRREGHGVARCPRRPPFGGTRARRYRPGPGDVLREEQHDNDAEHDEGHAARADPQPGTDLDAQGPAADLVRVYLDGIGKTALLTAADEVDLAQRIEAGVYAGTSLETGETFSGASGTARPRRAARDSSATASAPGRRLLEANLRLVVSLAKRYTGRGMPLLDLDPGGQPRPHPRGREVRLRQGLQVLDATRPGGSARPSPVAWPTSRAPSACPRRSRRRSTSWSRIRRDSRQKPGREATDEELAAEIGCPPRRSPSCWTTPVSRSAWT